MGRSSPRLLSFPGALLATALWAGCGNRIGDSCTLSTDCSQDGDRICDTFSPGGYCTIEGCDFGTCPDEAVCVRFFPVTQLVRSCASQADCALDELCVTGGKCAPLSTERRFCMLACDSQGGCREDYECRDVERMSAHGGEPVPDPDAIASETPRSFCASSKPCGATEDCDLGDTCDLSRRVCKRSI